MTRPLRPEQLRSGAMHLLIVGGSRRARLAAALSHMGEEGASVHIDPWRAPFLDAAEIIPVHSAPCLVRVDDIELSFPNRQTTGTRLVLTQSTYTVQRWLDRLGGGDRLIATASREALTRDAGEVFTAQGPWHRFEVLDLGAPDDDALEPRPSRTDAASELAAAFRLDAADARAAACRRLREEAPGSAAVALSLGSACREIQDLDLARDAIDAASRLAPEWAAVPFERGKLWLALDDLEHARDDFARAAALMPTFSAAFSNLGATLGELGEPEAAAAAFARALEHDPNGFTVWNNLGVVRRELGQLDASETALLRVVDLAPGFVFGHYNLGHTRFLKADYAGALRAYEEGQRRDPTRNRRQACRLALVRLANGDAGAAAEDLRQATEGAGGEREDLLLEAYEIAQALVATHPELPGCHAFVNSIQQALEL